MVYLLLIKSNVFQGDLSKNLYIIKRGHCDVVTSDLETKLEHLAPGDYFGEIEVK